MLQKALMNLNAVQALPDQLLNEKELAEKLKITHRSVITRRMSGDLPFIRVGRLIRYSWPDVVAHLRKAHSQN